MTISGVPVKGEFRIFSAFGGGYGIKALLRGYDDFTIAHFDNIERCRALENQLVAITKRERREDIEAAEIRIESDGHVIWENKPESPEKYCPHCTRCLKDQ